MEGLSLLFVGLHNMILGFAMVLVTTLQLNIPTIIAILVCSLLSVAGYTLVLESVREAKNSSQNKDSSDFDLYSKANKKALSNSLILVIALAVIAVACLFSQMYFVKLFAFALIACLFVSVYSAHAVGTTLGAALSNIATVSSKQKLSKNVETKPEPKKTTKKK